MSKFKNLIVVGGIIIFIGIILLFPFFAKVKSECKSQYGACPQELETGIKSQEAGNLYQTKKKITKYLKNNFKILDFSTQFKLPNILIVNVLIKKPSFLITNDANQKIATDQSGRVLGVTDNTTLPTVIVTGNLEKVGDVIDQKHLFALNLIEGVNQMYQTNVGKIIDNSLVVELPAGIKVRFPLSGDSQILLGSLRLVYGRIESGEQKEKYTEIDLRFKNPVLR